jgi:hypothetical protein
MLLLSELVTNVVRHMRPTTTFTIELILSQLKLRVSVVDGSPTPPVMHDRSPAGDYGMWLVTAMADRWAAGDTTRANRLPMLRHEVAVLCRTNRIPCLDWAARGSDTVLGTHRSPITHAVPELVEGVSTSRGPRPVERPVTAGDHSRTSLDRAGDSEDEGVTHTQGVGRRGGRR